RRQPAQGRRAQRGADCRAAGGAVSTAQAARTGDRVGLAVDPVQIEPVSSLKSLLARNFAGIFRLRQPSFWRRKGRKCSIERGSSSNWPEPEQGIFGR